MGAIFTLKPDQRLKWLGKALQQTKEGHLRPGEIYDVVSSARMAESLPPKVGIKMAKMLKEQLGLFSVKQQKFLMDQAEVTRSLRASMVVSAGAEEEEEEDDKPKK